MSVRRAIARGDYRFCILREDDGFGVEAVTGTRRLLLASAVGSLVEWYDVSAKRCSRHRRKHVSYRA